MEKRILGTTGLEIAPLVLGGNVFGWTIDQSTGFKVLDAFMDYGFNAIDTADVYSTWAEGNKGGESETIIGNWLKARPQFKDKAIIFTKVGSDMGGEGHKGLSEKWIIEEVEASLERLHIEAIDLYFSHWPDAETSYHETLGAYEKLLKAGKIKSIGASNLNAQQLGESLNVAKSNNLPSYQVLQPEYNLYDRAGFNKDLRELCISENIGVVTYYSIASGFLSGKYRSQDDLAKSQRGQGIGKYLNPRGYAILKALDEVAPKYDANLAEIALAWLMAQDAVTAPIASATSVEQVSNFAKAASLKLKPEDLQLLDKASA